MGSINGNQLAVSASSFQLPRPPRTIAEPDAAMRRERGGWVELTELLCRRR